MFSRVLAVFCIGLATLAMAQTPPPATLRERYQAAVAAYEKKDYGEYLKNLEAIAAERPTHPVVLGRLAGAYGLNDRPADVARVLRRMASLSLYHNVAADPDLGRVRSDADVASAARDLEQVRTRRIGSSAIAWTIHDTQLIPEGVAYDPVSRAFFVSSQYKRKIVRIDPSGAMQDFVTSGRDGVWMIFGMAVDPERRLLWSVSTAEPVMSGFTASDENGTGVFAYDLSSGKLARRLELPERGVNHRFDDLTVTKTGQVFASDAGSGAVYTIPPAGTSLEVFVPPGIIQGPNGLAPAPDGRVVYVSDYGGAIFRLDVASKTATRLQAPTDVALYGIDGLAWYNGSLIGVQNGADPARVLRLDLSPDGTAISAVRILDMNQPNVAEPTIGVVVGDTYYYVANSFGGLLRKPNSSLADQPLADPVILKLPLR